MGGPRSADKPPTQPLFLRIPRAVQPLKYCENPFGILFLEAIPLSCTVSSQYFRFYAIFWGRVFQTYQLGAIDHRAFAENISGNLHGRL